MDYPEKPLPLLTLDETGKWIIPDEARSVLESIADKITAVSIVGKYRGGKSYLMNVICGKHGFDIGTTIQAQTKGIWMWPVRHPKEDDRCLLLLDTEGLHDTESGDQSHDMQLFVFALLMSSCLIYNIKGSLDQTFIDELQMVAELTDNIKVKGGKVDESTAQQELKQYIPELIVVVRDFHLQLVHNDVPITPADYLEKALALQPGMGKKIAAYNTPRQCIREYFSQRQCFTLPKPVQDDKKINNLDALSKDELQKEFVEISDELVEYVLSKIKTMTIDGRKVSGQGFLNMLDAYVTAVNESGIPCIESAVESIKRHEQHRALDIAMKAYIEAMKQETENKFPLDTEELEAIHKICRETAEKEYQSIVRIKQEAKEFYKKIEEKFQEISAENCNVSHETSKAALAKCFKTMDDKLQSTELYYTKGGHALFKIDLEDAKTKYTAMKGLGPEKSNVLGEKMESIGAAEVAVLSSDQAMGKKEQEIAEIERKREAQERETARIQEEAEANRREMERIQTEQKESFEKYKQDNEERIKDEQERHKNEMETMKNNLKEMQDKKMHQQAEQLQMQIKLMEEERRRTEIENNKRREEIQAMEHKNTKNHQETMQMMQQQHNQKMEMMERQRLDKVQSQAEEQKLQWDNLKMEAEKRRLAKEEEGCRLM